MSYQTIYNRLRAAGLTEAGALGLIGNWECESNCESCRVQGDFSADRSISKSYASEIDNGYMSDETFSRDGKGWGLAQWTYWTRKAALLQFCRRRSISVASEEAQVDFALHELRTDFPALLSLLIHSGDLYQCVSAVCCQYERPAVNNVQARYEAALRIRERIDAAGKDSSSPAADQNDRAEDAQGSAEEDMPETPIWPPRVLCLGMIGADVMALQALLFARGYNPGSVSGIFDKRTHEAVIAFQRASGLKQDGIAGKNTWAKLTEIKEEK